MSKENLVSRIASRYAAMEDQTDVDGFNLAIIPKLTRIVEQHIRGAGKIVDLVAYAPTKGGGWVATLSTEYAALKLFYVYRNGDTHLTKGPKGWMVSVK